VHGKGYDVGVRGVLQLPRVGDLVQSVSFGLDYKHFDQMIKFGGAATEVPLRYVPFNVVYNVQREGPHFSTKASVGLTAGLRELGGDEFVLDKLSGIRDTAFDEARSGARSNFIHLNVEVTQTEALGRGFEAVQRLSGQISDQPLVSNEQFSAGGLVSVRGYLQSEAVGDDGFAGALEFRSPSLAPGLGGVLDDLRLYAFTDGAVLRVQRALAQQTDFFTLASSGVGLRLELLRHLQGDVSVAFPLIEGLATHSDRPHVTFSVKSEY
jgi:hemolysin activation/secretion protein